MRYRLRTLLILLALGPLVVVVVYWSVADYVRRYRMRSEAVRVFELRQELRREQAARSKPGARLEAAERKQRDQAFRSPRAGH